MDFGCLVEAIVLEASYQLDCEQHELAHCPRPSRLDFWDRWYASMLTTLS